MSEVHPETGTSPGSDVVEGAGYGAWTNHQIPEDRSAWHPMVRRFYEYWLSIAPPGRLPGRQHVRPEDIVPLLSRLWMVDVFRDPLRFRYRLVGTNVVNAIGCELTGRWLEEVQPEVIATRWQSIDIALSLRPAARLGGMAQSIGSETQSSARSKTAWCRWRL